MCRVEAVQEFGRRLDFFETYVKCFIKYNEADLFNPSQLLNLNEVTITDMLRYELGFIWFDFFKKKIVLQLYCDPYIGEIVKEIRAVLKEPIIKENDKFTVLEIDKDVCSKKKIILMKRSNEKIQIDENSEEQ